MWVWVLVVTFLDTAVVPADPIAAEPLRVSIEGLLMENVLFKVLVALLEEGFLDSEALRNVEVVSMGAGVEGLRLGFGSNGRNIGRIGTKRELGGWG